jgi:hypothetical protein
LVKAVVFVIYRVIHHLFFPLQFDFLNLICGFDSGEGIMVINGTGDILEGKAMPGMDMLCHQIRTQACTLQLQLLGLLNLGTRMANGLQSELAGQALNIVIKNHD